MKHLTTKAAFLAALAGAAVLTVTACTTAQTDKFVSGITNFNRGLSAVDQTVKNVNATIYANCNTIVSVAASINGLAGQCSNASTYTSVANSIVDNYCQTAAVQSAGIATSISVTASGVSAAKSQLTASKLACAS